ncbi:MAG: hypothetical protein ACFFAQ_08770 [Promethearchaeota archaeon]
MNEPSKVYEFSALKSMLLMLGAYTFSYCLGLTIHETGHALAYLIVGGISDIEIHVNPFTESHVSCSYVPIKFFPFTGAMGPLFNLFCSSIITLVLWRKRNPKLLPLLMLAGTNFIVEGVGILIDIGDLPMLSDWGKVMEIGGVSPIIMGIIAAVFIIIGSTIMLLLMPLVNVSLRDSYWKRVFISSGSILYFIFVVFYVSIFAPNLLEDKSIPLFSAIGFNILLMALYKPAFPVLDRISHTEISKVDWSAIIIAFGAAVAIISVDLIFFY